ncbi:MAG: hypothetical protein AAF957_26960 [Planctomycetota bacterium]
MIPALVALHARRVAKPVTVAVTVGVATLAALGAPVEPGFTGEFAVDADGVRAGATWTAGLVALVALTLVPAARIPARWFRAEGSWLGTSRASRSTIVASAGAGVAAGCLALTTAVAAVAAITVDDRQAEVYELGAVAGPTRSIVLGPGESFEQSLEGTALTRASRIRVRVMPTFGGKAPATRALHGTPDRLTTARVARRAWLEVPADPSRPRVAVTNVGDGALAVLGPDAVEVWRPSRALLGGHARLALHVALFVATLAAVALGVGAWMSPGIAALLAFALWIGARTALPTGWIPGGEHLGVALAAIGEGRSPSPLGAGPVATAVALHAAAWGSARAALGSWFDEVRA